MAAKQFHFMLSPVQSFISQARRTRDFWAGSFLLSWLSAVAMQAVLKQHPGNRIVFPLPDQDFLNWLEGMPSGKQPAHGCVPSRFQAQIDAEHFAPDQVASAVRQAWTALADLVYRKDVAAWANPETEQIWRTQIEHFWQIHWVLSDDEDNCILDRRKFWHNAAAPEQAGVKCMMIGAWQELSGEPRPIEEKLAAFWDKLIDNGKAGIAGDLRRAEYLSAPAFVKRRFVRYFAELEPVAMLPGNWKLSGWKTEPGRPSVSYMAAVHWLEKLLKAAAQNQETGFLLEQFHNNALSLTDGKHNEWSNNIACINKADVQKKWKSLDGNVFFDALLENTALYPKNKQADAQQVLRQLKHLREHLKLPAPTPFYAVLRMDGDNLSEQRMEHGKAPIIAEALHRFTKNISGTVYQHNGFLIYAGGDDVLAVLPLENALGCALAVRNQYRAIFRESKIDSTISAAIVYAHIKMPLAKVLKNSQVLLDEVAKKKYGRDSLAVNVLKGSGKVLEWARPWDKAIEGERLAIERLAEDLQRDDDLGGRFSSRFLYKIRERFELLNPQGETGEAVLNHDEALELMAAEYVTSGLCDKQAALEKDADGRKKMAHARALVGPLLAQCRPVYSDGSEDSRLMADAALLVRFLAHQGVA